MWNCQWQQIMSLLIYVFNESPFEMVGRSRSSFQMRCTFREADPPCETKWQQIKSSLIYVCNWEPIWNSHLHNSFTMCQALHSVNWCWAIGEVSHTCITYENEAIYVNFKFFLLFCCAYDFMLLLLFRVHNYIWTTTSRTATTKRMRIKIQVNWSFCSDSYSYYCVILLLLICNCECTMRDE